MLSRAYWVCRILGYAITLPAAILYITVRYSNPVLGQKALYGIGIGFLFFFVSYILVVVRRLSR